MSFIGPIQSDKVRYCLMISGAAGFTFTLLEDVSQRVHHANYSAEEQPGMKLSRTVCDKNTLWTLEMNVASPHIQRSFWLPAGGCRATQPPQPPSNKEQGAQKEHLMLWRMQNRDITQMQRHFKPDSSPMLKWRKNTYSDLKPWVRR